MLIVFLKIFDLNGKLIHQTELTEEFMQKDMKTEVRRMPLNDISAKRSRLIVICFILKPNAGAETRALARRFSSDLLY